MDSQYKRDDHEHCDERQTRAVPISDRVYEYKPRRRTRQHLSAYVSIRQHTSAYVSKVFQLRIYYRFDTVYIPLDSLQVRKEVVGIIGARNSAADASKRRRERRERRPVCVRQRPKEFEMKLHLNSSQSRARAAHSDEVAVEFCWNCLESWHVLWKREELEPDGYGADASAPQAPQKLRQYLYFCTSNASKRVPVVADCWQESMQRHDCLPDQLVVKR